MALVLITGCASGFGLEAALAFARAGDTVVATVRSPGREGPLLQRAAAEGVELHVRALDVSKPASFAGFVSALVADLGCPDVLVNNAGILRRGALEDLAEADIRAVMETNFFGPLLLTRALLPAMRERGAGVVIMMSSLSGVAGLAGDVVYSASKFALEGATEALHYECGRFGIRFALVQCGSYATGLHGPGGVPARASGSYPPDSPYRPLIEAQGRSAAAGLASAPHPRAIGELLPRVAAAGDGPLRWQADALAERVVGTLWRADAGSRDRFLREASAIDWWLDGQEAPANDAS